MMKQTVSVQTYADRSSIGRGAGAGTEAVLHTHQQPTLTVTSMLPSHAHTHHTVYKADLVHLMPATASLQQLEFLEDTSITINSQATIRKHNHQPAQCSRTAPH